MNIGVVSSFIQESIINNNKNLNKSLEKITSGLKINKASDDASGLAIADKLRTQASSIKQSITNGNSAIKLTQIADKSMAEQSNILDIVKSKLIQANTDTSSNASREAIRQDINKLLEQLDNIASQTNYNGLTLLQANSSDKNSTNELAFQVGEKSSDIISIGIIQANTNGLGGGTSSTTSVGSTVTSSETITFPAMTTSVTLAISHSGGGFFSPLSQFTPTSTSTIINTGSSNFNISDGFSSGPLFVGQSLTLTAGTVYGISSDNADFTLSGNFSSVTLDYRNPPNYMNYSGTYNTNSGGVSLSDLKALGEYALTKQESETYQAVLDDAVTKLNEYRGEMGSTQNQIESAVRNLMTQETNIKAAESIIRDVDYSVESANFNKLNVISQAGSFALSQANNLEKNILRFLE